MFSIQKLLVFLPKYMTVFCCHSELGNGIRYYPYYTLLSCSGVETAG